MKCAVDGIRIILNLDHHARVNRLAGLPQSRSTPDPQLSGEFAVKFFLALFGCGDFGVDADRIFELKNIGYLLDQWPLCTGRATHVTDKVIQQANLIRQVEYRRCRCRTAELRRHVEAGRRQSHRPD